MSNAVPRLIAGAAGIAALAFASDSFSSNTPNRNATQQALEWRTYEDQYINNSSTWSGNNAMDGAAIGLKNTLLNVRRGAIGFVENLKGVWRDGIMKDWPLWTVGLGGMYAALGPQHVNNFFNEFVFKRHSPIRSIFGSLFGVIGKGLRSGTMRQFGSWALQSIVNTIHAAGSSTTSATAALVVLGAGIFLMNRFINVFNGEAARENFNVMVEEGTTSNLYGNPFIF